MHNKYHQSPKHKKVFTFSYDAYKCGQLRLQWLKFPLETQTCRNIGVTNDISQKLSWIKKHRESHKLTHTCTNGLIIDIA